VGIIKAEEEGKRGGGTLYAPSSSQRKRDMPMNETEGKEIRDAFEGKNSAQNSTREREDVPTAS